MKYNDLLNELFDLLDQNADIKKIKKLKKRLLEDNILKDNLDNYRLYKTSDNKKILLSNQDYLEYLKCESNINFLIQDIKSSFNFTKRKC